MSPGSPDRPTLLVVGGCGGLVGRAILEEFAPDHRIVSVHRHPVPRERDAGVRWERADLRAVDDWTPYLENASRVLLLAWYRAGSRRRFAPLADAYVRLVRDAERLGGRRIVHLSVPDAPVELERDLAYLAEKRRVDRTLEASSLDFTLLRPTLLYGEHDRLLTVMLRLMHRYRRFPMFGDGNYHVSPLASRDLARIVRREFGRPGRSTVPAGGPRRWRYRELTDRMFRLLGLEPRYVRLGPATSVRLARLMETVGLRTIYAYEVTWLLSDRLGLDPYLGLEPPLAPVEPFLEAEARRLLGR